MAERTTKVRLTAQVQQYIEGMEQAAKATRETGSEAEKLSRQREAFEQLGRASMVAGGAVVAGLTMAAKAAITWDSAWAGVLKTVDGSTEQLALVEQGLRDLTGILPASHTEIAAVAEAAGQLGIETPNVVSFTKSMIDLGETTNLTSEQAAMSLARFMNIMGTAQGDVAKLGASLVGLGNNYATTESEILEMSMRLAKSGVQIGLTEGEVLGLATALSSVGIEAEAGGSAMSKVMIDIAASVEEGGDRLEMFARTSGMTADEFAQKWKTAPAEALAAFVKGLANAEQQGGSTLGVLAELGITEVRMRDALLGSAAAADDFAGAMAMGNGEFEKGTALTEEAEKRYETTAAKLQIMSNKVVDAAIGIGEKLLPALEAGADAVGTFADTLSGLGGPMEAVVAWGGLIIGTGLLGAGVWMAAIPKIAEYRAALVSLELAGGRLVRTMSAVAKIGGAVAAWGTLIALAREADADVEQLTDALEHNASVQVTLAKAAEANANRGYGSLVSALVDTEITAKDTADAFDYLRDKADGWYMNRLNQGVINDTIKSLGLIGDELAKVAATDLGRVQASLKNFADELDWSRDDMWAFIENSDALKSALEMQAESLGLTTGKVDLLKIAYGEVGPAAEDSGDSARSSAEDYMTQANAARAAADELFKLIDALMAQNSAAQTAESANARYQQTLADVAQYIEDAQAGLDGYSTSIDGNTLAGAKNRSMFAGLAADSQAAAQAIMEQEVATLGSEQALANYNARLADGREALINQITALTGNRDAAVELADVIYKIPDEHETRIAVETAAAAAAVNNLVADIESRRPRMIVEIGYTGERLQQAVLAGANANGNLHAYANGGIQEFAGGGFPTGIYSGGAPIHKFAEPETLWEAYISGKPDQRDRNRQIWVETGERLGVMQEIRAALQGGAGPRQAGPLVGSVSFGGDQSQRQQFREFEDTLDRISRRVQ